MTLSFQDIIEDSIPDRKLVTPTAKRKALRAGAEHPGHERIYCPKIGAYKMMRRDDEMKVGDGFGGNMGRFLWQEKSVKEDHQKIRVHCVIEGSPLSGKSTVARNLTEYCRAKGYPTRLMLEVPESWQDSDGGNLLDKQAQDPLLYSVHLQAMILVRQGKLLAERGGYDGIVLQDRFVDICFCIIITDRYFSSHLSGRYVYSERSRVKGFMSAQDILLLDGLMEGIEAIAGRLNANPGAVMFLAPPLNTLMRRLGSRGQVGDDQLGEELLADLQRRHEELAVLYINLGYDVLMCRADLTPSIYPKFEAEFFNYLRYLLH